MSKRRERVTCPFCARDAKLATGLEVYPHRQDLADLFFWWCEPCDAHVGCHRNSPTHKPLGTLADRNTRAWRSRAHAAFDPYWKSGAMSRTQAYHTLADRLGLPRGRAHISWMDIDQCRRVVEVFSVNQPSRSTKELGYAD